jgi:hypothetical protein
VIINKYKKLNVDWIRRPYTTDQTPKSCNTNREQLNNG